MSEPYTPEEQRAYDEGRAAYKADVDYFSCPYMRPPRDIFLLCAWTEGWLAEAGEVNCAKCAGRHDPEMPCVAMPDAAAEDRIATRAR